MLVNNVLCNESALPVVEAFAPHTIIIEVCIAVLPEPFSPVIMLSCANFIISQLILKYFTN